MKTSPGETSMIRQLAEHSSTERVEVHTNMIIWNNTSKKLTVTEKEVPPPLAGQAIPIGHRDRY